MLEVEVCDLVRTLSSRISGPTDSFSHVSGGEREIRSIKLVVPFNITKNTTRLTDG